MYRTTLTLGFLMLSLPLSMLAYGTPEEILFQSSGYATLKPPIQRETGDRIEDQRRKSEERREAEQAEIFTAQQKARAPSAPMRPAAASSAPSEPTLEGVLSNLQESIDRLNTRGEEGDVDGEDNADDRESDDREDLGMTIAPWEDPTRNGGNDQVLHSGAPLTPTGAGSWLAAGTILATIVWTLYRVKPAKTNQ